MALNSPGTILKLWSKTAAKLEDGKKPADLPKKGNEQRLKIKNGLTALKLEAPTAKKNPKAFIVKRDKAALLLRKFCRYLKTAKDEDKKLTQKYLKTVMGLAVVVANLDPGNIDLSEDDGSLESLDAQDTSTLAAALEKPDSEPDVEDSPGPQNVEPGTSAKSPTTKSEEKGEEKAETTPPTDEKADQWKERHSKFVPHLKDFLHAGAGDIAGVTKLYGDATAAAKKGAYDDALGILDKLEPMMVKGAVGGAVGWQKAKIETINQIRQLQTALVKTKRPGALQIARMLESVPKGLEIHPDSEENLKALETYIATDNIINKAEKPNPWGIQIAIREPLMKALERLKT
jgi:hypothetical protein